MINTVRGSSPKPRPLTHLRDLLTTRQRAIPRRHRIAHVDLISLLRQLCAQVEDEALCGDLGDLLVLDAERLRQTFIIDLDAARVCGSEAPGQVCFGCLQRAVDGTKRYWDPRQGGPGEHWVCGECERHNKKSR